MFEKLMQAAERTATGVSRRGFLGRFGRAAAVTAAAVAGVAAAAGEAQAGGGNGCPQGTHRVNCPHGGRTTSICCPPGKQCRCNHIGCYCG